MDQSISEHLHSNMGNGADRAQMVESREGLIHVWVESGLGVVEETVRASFGFLDDVRGETQERIGATLDWVEGFDRSAFRVARKALGRASSVGSRVLSGGEQSWLALLGALRRTSRGAASLASETVTSVVGERRAQPYAMS